MNNVLFPANSLIMFELLADINAFDILHPLEYFDIAYTESPEYSPELSTLGFGDQ